MEHDIWQQSLGDGTIRHCRRPSLGQPEGSLHFPTCFFKRWISIWSTKQFGRVRFPLYSPLSSVRCLTCNVSRIRFSSSSSLISSLISLLEHIKAVSVAPPQRAAEAGFSESYLCWVFIWLNWSLRSLSSARSCSTSAGVRPDGCLPGWGSEVARDAGFKMADRALGSSEEKDCVCTLLGTVTPSLDTSECSSGWFTCSSSIVTVDCKEKPATTLLKLHLMELICPQGTWKWLLVEYELNTIKLVYFCSKTWSFSSNNTDYLAWTLTWMLTFTHRPGFTNFKNSYNWCFTRILQSVTAFSRTLMLTHSL